MNIFVTGGAGYIGSHTVRQLLNEGNEVVVFDCLENGHKEALDSRADFVEGNLSDINLLSETILNKKPEAVIHFAGNIESGESMSDPEKFFRNNFSNALNLVKVMKESDTKSIIFSSTAGVYGTPKELPIKEEAEISTTSYYSMSKYFFEEALRASTVYGIKSVILRYFNAAGASLDGSMGEDHNPESHLIPLIIFAALGKRDKICIYGDDYDTKDGTGVRDYVHVEDLAVAHIKALEKFGGDFKSDTYNVGVGEGYSVKEVIDTVKDVSGIDFKVEIEPRRPGDWAVSYADSSKIQKELGWKPKYGLKEIVETAYQWHKSHPEGYGV